VPHPFLFACTEAVQIESCPTITHQASGIRPGA
jgi:hypothetical protein